MKQLRLFWWVAAGLGAVWLCLCAVIGILLGEGALHPGRMPLSARDESLAEAMMEHNDAQRASVSIRAGDGTELDAWQFQPAHWNGDYVLLLHGQGDNRAGMLGPADTLLRHGFGVLLPDSRAHGTSGGAIATYGVLERSDVRDWFDWIQKSRSPHCVDAIGDSMGAAQVLESLSAEPGFCAVIAECPFATFREAAYDRMGQQFGTGPWLGRTLLRPAVELGLLYARARYGIALGQAVPAEAVAESKVPVLLIHGLEDDDLPPRHSDLIVEWSRARGRSVALWEPADAGHCQASSAEPAEYESRVTRWFETHDQ